MRLLIVLIIALLLSGCSWFTKPIDISTAPIDKVPLIVPEVDQIEYRKVEWVIVTPENVQSILKDFVYKGNVSLFALTSVGYENLSLNTSDVLKLIKQQKEIINAYENYYNTFESTSSIRNEAKKAKEDKIPDIE